MPKDLINPRELLNEIEEHLQECFPYETDQELLDTIEEIEDIDIDEILKSIRDE